MGFVPHIVPHQHYVFNANTGFNSDFYCPPTWCEYKAEPLRAQKALGDSFSADIPFTHDIQSYIPAKALCEIWQEIIINVWKYFHNTPKPNRHLLCIAEKYATYKTNILQTYYQHLSSEKCAATTATASATITSKAHH